LKQNNHINITLSSIVKSTTGTHYSNKAQTSYIKTL